MKKKSSSKVSFYELKLVFNCDFALYPRGTQGEFPTFCGSSKKMPKVVSDQEQREKEAEQYFNR